MKCPKCGFEWKDQGRVKGGKTSRRTLTTKQAKEMSKIRWKKKRT